MVSRCLIVAQLLCISVSVVGRSVCWFSLEFLVFHYVSSFGFRWNLNCVLPFILVLETYKYICTVKSIISLIHSLIFHCYFVYLRGNFGKKEIYARQGWGILMWK